MKVKLLIDEDVHSGLSEALRKRGYDAVNVQEINKRGCSDDEIIIEAVKDARCIFTFNVKDYVKLHKKMVELNEEHKGIIVAKQLTFSETLKKLLKLLQSVNSESMKNKLEFL